MKIISHRGNSEGPNSLVENNPSNVDAVLSQGFDAEIDVWVLPNERIFLGHDEPQIEIKLEWLRKSKQNLWIHCKNANALQFFDGLTEVYNYFYHQVDPYTLTSNGKIWVYPGCDLLVNSIYVLPEINRDQNGRLQIPSNVYGVCTDFPYEVAGMFPEALVQH